MSETPAEPALRFFNEDGSPNWNDIGIAFRKPMASKTRKGRGGMQFSYIDARQVENRLDAVVGVGNWSDNYMVHDSGAVECTLTVCGVSKSDVGYSNNPDANEGDAMYEYEALKAAYSDAFKRAAVKFGIGRWLYMVKP